MKKILFIITSFIIFNLSANLDSDPNSTNLDSANPDVKTDQLQTNQFQIDQFQIILGPIMTVYNQAMQFCSEKGYNYFKFLKISYKDENGQIMQFKGICKDKNGKIIKDSIKLPFADIKTPCDFEIICFKDKVKDKTVCDVQKYMQLIKQFQTPAEKIAGSKVIEITSIDQLKKEISSSKIPVFVDCYSNSCPPCKVFSPIFDKYSIEKASYGKFLKVNVTDIKEISKMYQIRGVPTLLIFEKNGKLQEKKTGLPDITQYLDGIKTK